MLNLKVLILKIGKIGKIRDLWYENRTARNRPIFRRNYGKSVLMLNILLIADIVSKIISLVIFVCLAMWSIRNLKDHDVSYATAILRQVIKTTVSKGLLYSTGGPCGAVHNSI